MFFAYCQVDCHIAGKCWGSSWNLLLTPSPSPYASISRLCTTLLLHSAMRPERESTHKALKQEPSITAREQGSGKKQTGMKFLSSALSIHHTCI